jgi:hypothetical protein
MKSTIFNALRACGLYLLVTVACVSAQSRTWIIANVPFDFVVKNQHFAAGAYSVTVSRAQGSLLIRGEDNGSATFALSYAAQRDKAERYPTLVFNRYGDRYFLSQVWPVGSDSGRALTPSKMEEELASRTGRPEIVALLVSESRSRRPAR